MIKRLKTSTGVVAGLAALALGGSAIASAAGGSPTKAKTQESTTAPDTDNIQSGDQTSPDTKGTKSKESTTAPDTDNIQSGDQTSPDTKGTGSKKSTVKNVGNLQTGSQTTPDRGTTSESSTSETSGESSAETAPNNDGPGGYADEPGNPNADTQQQGQN